ncbi:MAG: hypothetical protein ABI051_05295 [Vicinamibacterales bacterium]
MAAPAAAQGQLGAGISFLHDTDNTGVGFTVDYASVVKSARQVDVSLVGDLGWHHFDFGSVSSYMGGVRVGGKPAAFSPFAQFLIGATHQSVSDCSACNTTDVSFAPGFGANFAVSPQLNLRAQVDFLRIHNEFDTTNVTRFWFGVVVPVGGR